MIKRIYTDRLILRPFTFEDIPSSYKMNLDEEVSKFTGDGGVVSLDEMHRRITEDVMGDYKKYGYGRLVVELKETGEFIGFCGLKYLDDINKVDIGFRFMKEYWGMGYATESASVCMKYGFDELELSGVIAWVLPENTGSIRVLEKLGMQFEREFEEEGLLVREYIKTREPLF